jgi:hypothetical protein
MGETHSGLEVHVWAPSVAVAVRVASSILRSECHNRIVDKVTSGGVCSSYCNRGRYPSLRRERSIRRIRTYVEDGLDVRVRGPSESVVHVQKES